MRVKRDGLGGEPQGTGAKLIVKGGETGGFSRFADELGGEAEGAGVR